MLATLLVCLTVVYLTERLLRVWQAEQRRRAEAQSKATPAEPIPTDLRVWASKWADEWAREQARSALDDAYARTGPCRPEVRQSCFLW